MRSTKITDVLTQSGSTASNPKSIDTLFRSFLALKQQANDLHTWLSEQAASGDVPPEIETAHLTRCDEIAVQILAIGSRMCDIASQDHTHLRMKAEVLSYLLPEEEGDPVVQLANSLCRDVR